MEETCRVAETGVGTGEQGSIHYLNPSPIKDISYSLSRRKINLSPIPIVEGAERREKEEESVSDQHLTKKPRKDDQSCGEQEQEANRITVEVEAKDVIQFHLRGKPSEHTNCLNNFIPEFTHQIFGESQKIIGYVNPKIDINICRDSLRCSARISFDKRICEMPGFTADICTKLEKGLPPDTQFCSVDNNKLVHESFNNEEMDSEEVFVPPGKLISEEIDQKNPNVTNMIYRCEGSDPSVIEYHSRAQRFAVWFIETADDVDSSDDRWTFFYLFNRVKGNNSRFNFMGYMTVFNFINPLKGVSVRICQALLLPPYQRKGFGLKLMQTVYNWALNRKQVYEITVEDPAPGFVGLRNVTDTNLCIEKNVFEKYKQLMDQSKDLSSESIPELQQKIKLTKDQIYICYEMTRFLQLRNLFSTSNENNSDDEEKLKAFRLMVKRRLMKLHKYDILAELSKELLKSKLEELYHERIVYMKTLFRL